MRIKSVGVENFRCLNSVEIDFMQITTFIGPNGAGKSSVLRALDWFFNGGLINESDVWSGSTEKRVRVRVTFDALTDSDRVALGEKYAPSSASTFTAWRTWINGQDKMTGNALTFPPFEEVRTASGATAKKEVWGRILKDHPDEDLPKWSSASKIDSAMDEWERTHPEQLQESESGGSHLFGFNGQNVLSGIFDYVLVTADLRANEESQDARGTIISRILEKTVDRGAADQAYSQLAEEMASRRETISKEHLDSQLEKLSADLSSEIEAFTSGRKIHLSSEEPEMKLITSKIRVTVRDQLTQTDVDRQGHGFQRALLISSLKMLASKTANEDSESVICLAIEEPELFQHPTQARAFSNVLRTLASDNANGLQITYATHSPYFVDSRYFDEIRRVRRSSTAPDQHAEVAISHAKLDAVASRLAGYVDPKVVTARWDLVCNQHLSEALFADAAMLVEGDDDKAVFEGIAARTKHLSTDGIAVAAAQGKGHLYIPHAILSELNIPTMVVFDNDSGCEDRMIEKKKHETDPEKIRTNRKNIKIAVEKHISDNHALQHYFHLDAVDYPVGTLSPELHAVDDTLETMIDNEWPSWNARLQVLVENGQGVGNKNAATYALASTTCSEGPSDKLTLPVNGIRILARTAYA
ncbi:ATP-dependent endonuclease [Kocuria palustris]|uniref:ATP-dependent nuclease n=1 Tax=Kocuria palustris TaxID=71999 RepID=UPI0021A68FF3|nr:ATP-dependent endonuclease [Kocuria palustris]MCT1834168.1 ATP-dependent endonuclease [Kocuria palustris]